MLQLVTSQTCAGVRTAAREQEGKQILLLFSERGIVSLQVEVHVGAGRARSQQGLV